MIFVDTGAWFAVVVPSEIDHRPVSEWLSRNREPLVTTDYIIDETLTLLRARGQARAALALGRQFFEGGFTTVHHVDKDDVTAAWRVFEQFSDKRWSFTDCTSKVVIERFHLSTALTLDHHFRQFGGIQVVP